MVFWSCPFFNTQNCLSFSALLLRLFYLYFFKKLLTNSNRFIGASRRCVVESFARAFSKARRLVMFSQKTHDEGTCARSNTSRSAVASAEAKFLFAAFLFCQAREALAPPGGVKRSQFSFGPSVSKKKAGNRFKKCLRAKGNSLRECEVPPPLSSGTKGNPPLVRFPSFRLRRKFTLRWRFGRIREFRPLRRATADRGGSDELLKKLEQNFQTDNAYLADKLQFTVKSR